MQDKITLELTVDEVIMLQVLTKNFEGGPKWIFNIYKSLAAKIGQAYQKPVISIEEYEKRISTVKEKWEGCVVLREMVRAEKSRIKFYNELPSEVDIWE